MTLLEFEAMELNAQLELVVEEGTPIAQIRKIRKGFLLYALYGYYVELDMAYKQGKTDVIAIRAFHTSPLLKKYLEQIDLSDIGLGKAA